MNFFKETIDGIKKSNHKENDVMFIGSADGKFRMNFQEFKNVSDFYYDNEFGSQKIPIDLIVYFNDKTYLHRLEWEGNEWWEYYIPIVFTKEDKYKNLKSIELGEQNYIYELLIK